MVARQNSSCGTVRGREFLEKTGTADKDGATDDEPQGLWVGGAGPLEPITAPVGVDRHMPEYTEHQHTHSLRYITTRQQVAVGIQKQKPPA